MHLNADLFETTLKQLFASVNSATSFIWFQCSLYMHCQLLQNKNTSCSVRVHKSSPFFSSNYVKTCYSSNVYYTSEIFRLVCKNRTARVQQVIVFLHFTDLHSPTSAPSYMDYRSSSWSKYTLGWSYMLPAGALWRCDFCLQKAGRSEYFCLVP